MSRNKVEYRTGSKGEYNRFCEKHPEVKLTFDEWSEILYTFNQSFRDYLLETGERAKLPFGLGGFAVGKKKIKKFKYYQGQEYVNLPIDWQKTRKAGKRIYNFNSHTDGYSLKWYWFDDDSRFYHSNIWVFKPSRDSSRKIAEYIKRPQQIEVYKQWQRKR